MARSERPKPLKRKSVRVDGVFDIECYGWDNFLVGVTLTADGDCRVWHDPESMFGYLYGLGGSWWGHNAGKYDILQALDVLCKEGEGQSIAYSNGRVTRTMGGGLVMRDSYSLIPMGLEDVAVMGGVQIPKLWFDCTCSHDCGGYCRLAKRMPYYMKERVIEYCIQDCQALLAGMSSLCEFAAEHDYDLCGTIGGSAWATVRRTLGIADSDIPAAQWRALRSGYFGGRCSVFRPRVNGPGGHYDIGSAYPHSLANVWLPVGVASEMGSGNALAALSRDRPGMYACTVIVPDCKVPPLPWVWGEGLAFPVGEVSGVWTLLDLQEAVRLGCTIQSVHWGIVWDAEERVFGQWVKDIYKVRSHYGKKHPFGKWTRWFPNSLCGKFAERPDKRMLRMNPETRDIVYCDGKSPCTLTTCVCGSWVQEDKWGHIWSVPFWRMSDSSHVHWAACITAASRIQHAGQLRAHGDDAVYCDTDSLWTTGESPPEPAGDGLGEWSRKCGFLDFESPAPKAYAYTDDKTGEYIISYAGALLSVAEWTKGEASQDRGVLSILDAARAGGGLFKRAHRTWTLPRHGEWYGDRRLRASSGMTVPATCTELRIRLYERDRKRRDARDSSTGTAEESREAGVSDS